MQVKNLKSGASVFCFEDLGDFCNNLETFMANDDGAIQKGLSVFISDDADVIITNALKQGIKFDFKKHYLRESFVQVYDFNIHKHVDVLVYDLVVKATFTDDDFEQ